MFTALEGTSDTKTCRLLLAQKGCSYMPPGISSALGSPKPHQLPSGLLHWPPDFPDLLPFHKTYEITLWKIIGFSILKNLQSSTLPKGTWGGPQSHPSVWGRLCSCTQPSPPHPTQPHPTLLQPGVLSLSSTPSQPSLLKPYKLCEPSLPSSSTCHVPTLTLVLKCLLFILRF